jgi:hypothetical protein
MALCALNSATKRQNLKVLGTITQFGINGDMSQLAINFDVFFPVNFWSEEGYEWQRANSDSEFQVLGKFR